MGLVNKGIWIGEAVSAEIDPPRLEGLRYCVLRAYFKGVRSSLRNSTTAPSAWMAIWPLLTVQLVP
jgi:hypothetical protein